MAAALGRQDVLGRVDAHRLGCRSAWSSALDPLSPPAAAPPLRTPARDAALALAIGSRPRPAGGWEGEAPGGDLLSSRRARIRLLEGLVGDTEGWSKAVVHGTRWTTARAHREHVAHGLRPLRLLGGPRAPRDEARPETPGGDGAGCSAASAPPSPTAVSAARLGAPPHGPPAEVRLPAEARSPRQRVPASPRERFAAARRAQPASARWRRPSTASLEEEGEAPDASVGGLPELERLVRGGAAAADAAQLRALAAGLEVRAYQLRLGDALRAAVLLAQAADGLAPAHSGDAAQGRPPAADAVRSAAHRILASVSTRIGQGDARLAADALAAMAASRVGRQEYLDAILAHLLSLLRGNPGSFTTPVVARVVGSLGRMQEEGGIEGCSLCVRGGVSPDHRAANARFLAAFNAHFLDALPRFLEDDFGAMHETYLAWHVGEDILLRLFHRAGQLQLGLLPATAQHLELMRRTLERVRGRFPGLLATLPEFPRQYCERLTSAD